MTIPGVDMVVALAIMAAIGEVGRFKQPQQLVSYFDLNPSVRQSGPGPAYHGRITKQGRGHARGMLVEAAWAAARAPGPLRAFFLRVRARRDQHVAAVATARKLAVIIWHLLSKGTKASAVSWPTPGMVISRRQAAEALVIRLMSAPIAATAVITAVRAAINPRMAAERPAIPSLALRAWLTKAAVNARGRRTPNTTARPLAISIRDLACSDRRKPKGKTVCPLGWCSLYPSTIGAAPAS
jgi:hypothetical protein